VPRGAGPAARGSGGGGASGASVPRGTLGRCETLRGPARTGAAFCRAVCAGAARLRGGALRSGGA
jgi:hypothetical protein